MKEKSISEIIADFALDMKLEDVPQEVIDYGKCLLTDTFGIAISCRELEHSKALRKTVMAMESVRQATLWGTDDKAMLADAAMYNSTLIHGIDFDDTHVGGIVHPSAAVVSTAVTVGEMTGASGAEIFEAIICGWEIIIRLALAARGRFHDAGFHGTGIVSPFAAACVAAKLMGDSRETLINAMGICGSQAAAIQQFSAEKSWTKKIHTGWACHCAIYALSMARNGFIGPREVFEGKYGMWVTHCGAADGLREEFSDLGRRWHTTEVTVKLYPVCHMTHSFIDCMIRVMEREHLQAEDIERVECRIESRCYPIVCEPRGLKTRPDSEYCMKFSLPYVVAVAAKYRKLGVAQVDMKLAEDPEICALMDRVSCVDDDSKRNPGYFPGYITVTLKDGRVFVEDQRYEMGTAQNPLDMAAVKKKFADNLEGIYTAGQVKALTGCINNFEKLTDVKSLIKALKA